MMTIPADNDDDKSAFSMPSIYISVSVAIWQYHAECWIDFISCTLPKGEHNFLLRVLRPLSLALCANFLSLFLYSKTHIPFAALSIDFSYRYRVYI